jgi:hypothetical protein
MLNPPTPPKKPSNNPLMNFFSTIFNLITHPRLANFAQVFPYFILGLGSFFVGLQSNTLLPNLNPQDVNNKDFKQKVCENSKSLVEERLGIEERNVTIGKTSSVDNKNNSNTNNLPFSCEYTLIGGSKKSDTIEISIELNPLFSDLINDINKDFEEKINLKNACTDPTITKQMEERARKNGNYKDGDEIIPKSPKYLEKKKDVYPVFRWVCSYNIKKQGADPNNLKGRDEYTIDFKLEPYCESQAKQKRTNRIKPTHHNYKDPYSLHCVDPHAK